MKKVLSVLTVLTILGMFTVANAGNYDNKADAGGIVEIDVGNTDATSNIEFQPSTAVIMTGASDATAFAHGAYHQAVENKNSGKQFAMASDTNVVFFLDISPDGETVAEDLSGVTNAAAVLATSNWHTM